MMINSVLSTASCQFKYTHVLSGCHRNMASSGRGTWPRNYWKIHDY